MLEGLGIALGPLHLLVLVLGAAGGILVGCLPGVSATLAAALIVPFTFTMEPSVGLVMIGGMYVGANYGDAIPAILINTPGTAAAIATTFDGYPLARAGKAQHALVAACFSSMVGALIGGFAVLLVSPPLARFSLRFGPPEYFWLSVFALAIIGSIAGRSLLKGLAGGALGILVSTVGIAPGVGGSRFTFGFPQLVGGVPLVVALIGLFAVPQVLRMVTSPATGDIPSTVGRDRGIARRVIADVARMRANLIRSSLLGVGLGILPGLGGPVSSLLAWSEERRWSKDKENMGKGKLEGVVASESATNASAPASVIPLLTLGVPGSPVAAIILGALFLHGLQPGGDMFQRHPEITYSFGWAMVLGGIVTFALGSLLSPYLARVVELPTSRLAPLIVVLCVIGSYAMRNNLFDVYLMVIIGLAAYVLERLGFHPGPIALGLILGPIIEGGLTSSLSLARASSTFEVFFARPLSIVFIALTGVVVAWVGVSRLREWREEREHGAGEVRV